MCGGDAVGLGGLEDRGKLVDNLQGKAGVEETAHRDGVAGPDEPDRFPS
jgi:hypothetical protein